MRVEPLVTDSQDAPAQGHTEPVRLEGRRKRLIPRFAPGPGDPQVLIDVAAEDDPVRRGNDLPGREREWYLVAEPVSHAVAGLSRGPLNPFRRASRRGAWRVRRDAQRRRWQLDGLLDLEVNT